jgi:hypothetical protein
MSIEWRDEKYIHISLSENLKGGDHFGYLDVNGRKH